ncbi:MAG: DUF177 domain-containing protein [Acidobacteria bacterium]|nr:DUF177 domain-containing protein [Acidobacteriota bacterium]
MLLDLTHFRTPVSRVDRTIDPAGLSDPGGLFEVSAPVVLGLDVHKDKARYRLVGRVQTTLTLACSRCLEPFELPVDAAFDIRLLPASEQASGGDSELPDEEMETSFYGDEQVDLSDLLREQCYLALPMKPLCRDDCRGLCPQCGTNLNTQPCACVPAWDDPRLDPLRGLAQGRSRPS